MIFVDKVIPAKEWMEDYNYIMVEINWKCWKHNWALKIFNQQRQKAC